MIISFSGAQSTGKSTLLNAMKADPRYVDWKFEPEITRSLKEKLGLEINELGDDFTQLAVINSHMENVLKHKSNNAVLDRCILDGLTYTTYLHYTAGVSEYVAMHAAYMFNLLINKYDIIFYIEPEFPIVDDGVRSIDEKFRNKIAELFEVGIDHYKVPVVRLKGSVEERLKIINETIENRIL